MQIILKIAVPVPVREIFDYLPPDHLESCQLCPGVRFSVPFGSQQKIGVLVEVTNQSGVSMQRLKKATLALDTRSQLTRVDLELMLWASRYYHYPVGEVVLTAFPILLRRGKPARISSEPRYESLLRDKKSATQLSARAHRQRALLAYLNEHPGGRTREQLDTLGWKWRDAFRSLSEKGLARKNSAADIEIDDFEYIPPSYDLNNEQQSATSRVLDDIDRFNINLLDGITGSGKTEVYFQVIHAVLKQQKQVMVLLPEITLTPQLEERFKLRFKTQICVFHSRLTEETRKNAWLRAANGQAAILLGTRSAVFTPMKNPGLVILDEEHDTSFKQQEGFRFSARDVAIKRAQLLDIPVLLGSATPSLETIFNARQQRYKHLKLHQRTGNASPPAVQSMDIRKQPMTEGLCARLLQEISHTLKQKEQVLLFINRRGYAPALTCHSCGWVAQCRRCDTSLVFHSGDNCLRCHHCGAQQLMQQDCPQCNEKKLVAMGLGTERVEQILEKIFPDARIARIDRDNTRRKGSLESLLADIHDRKTDILVGTQMLAKGHHFPDVTLVGILDTDSGLFSVDFRATERLAQLIVQVSGRAGRDRKPGRVILQTRHPDHPLLKTLIARGYSGFAEVMLAERRECALPPYSFQAMLRAEAGSSDTPLKFLQQISSLAHSLIQLPMQLLGPVPAPMTKRAGRYRFQLLFQSPDRKNLHTLLKRLLPKIDALPESKRVKWSIDIDPADLY